MIREIMARPQEIAWLPWAVQYFFFIGFGLRQRRYCRLAALA